MIMENKHRQTTDYTKKHCADGTTHGVGSSRFAGRTRDFPLTENSVRRTTYGMVAIDRLVCTIFETVKIDLIDSGIKLREDNEDVRWFKGIVS